MMMLDAGHILFEGTYEAFSQSNSPVIRPYFELMPKLHQGLDDSSDPGTQHHRRDVKCFSLLAANCCER